MKTGFKFFIICLALFSVILVACNKEEDDNKPKPNETQKEGSSARLGDANGVLAAIKTISLQKVMGLPIEVEVNSASAAFYKNPGDKTLISGGQVAINGGNLKKYDNNAYVYDMTASPLDLSKVNWGVTGQTPISGFTKEVTKGFPTYSKFASVPETFSISSDLTLPLASAFTKADSVVVLIAGSKGAVTKFIKPGNTDLVISAQELSKLGTGANGLISIAPYNLSYEIMAGNKIYFVNESNFSKSGVNITD